MQIYLADSHLRRAFSRVKENHGCAGVDEISLAGFEATLAGQIDVLRGMVQDESYFTWPLRKIEIEKSPGSEERRTLLVPSVRDRVFANSRRSLHGAFSRSGVRRMQLCVPAWTVRADGRRTGLPTLSPGLSMAGR